jgi:hypothetical protein
MIHVLLDVNNVVIATNDGPASGYMEAPDNVAVGWQLNGQTWEKSPALLAIEAILTDLASKRSVVNGDIATLLTWADFHENTVFDGWDVASTADKLAWTKTLHRRFGIFLRRFADFYQGHQFKP